MSIKSYKEIFLIARRLQFTQHKTWYQSLQYRRLFHWFVDINHAKPDAKVLDWGGGQGHASVMASSCGLSATLFSIVNYEQQWEKLKEYCVEFVFNDQSSSALPFHDNCFDYSFSCGVLEHVREAGGNELDSLTELARVTSKRVLIYHLPNKYSWIEFLTRTFFSSRYSHPYRYTKKDILALVQGVEGLAVFRMCRYGVLPRRLGANLPGTTTGSVLDAADSLLLFSPLRFVSQCWCVELVVKDVQ